MLKPLEFQYVYWFRVREPHPDLRLGDSVVLLARAVDIAGIEIPERNRAFTFILKTSLWGNSVKRGMVNV